MRSRISRTLGLTFVLFAAWIPITGISASAATPVFINEIHYYAIGGGQAADAIEIAAPPGTDLTGWSLWLYEHTGASYAHYDLGAELGVLATGFGVIPRPGMPDERGGLALVNADGVVQFLSYGGAFIASSGPAAGMTATDIGVTDGGMGLQSVQLTGTGSVYEDFTWIGPVGATFGEANQGQTLLWDPADPDPDPEPGPDPGPGQQLDPIVLADVLLWPPNGWLVPVTIVVDGAEVEVLEVVSSEADSGLGGSDRPGDIGQIAGDTVELRAERFSSDGRIYTVTVQITGAEGVTEGTVRVIVPHDLRNGRTDGAGTADSAQPAGSRPGNR